MLDHPILILMKYLTKKYPRKKQDDHQILPEEVLGIFLFMAMMMKEKSKSRARGTTEESEDWRPQGRGEHSCTFVHASLSESVL